LNLTTNTVSASGTAVLVTSDTFGFGAAQPASATISSGTYSGGDVGIDVVGGSSATLSGTTVVNNSGTGLRQPTGGTATVNNVDFRGDIEAENNGTDIQMTATAGALNAANLSTTGVLTGNKFAGALYIDNLTTQNLTVLASANTFSETGADANFRIEDRM